MLCAAAFARLLIVVYRSVAILRSGGAKVEAASLSIEEVGLHDQHGFHGCSFHSLRYDEPVELIPGQQWRELPIGGFASPSKKLRLPL